MGHFNRLTFDFTTTTQLSAAECMTDAFMLHHMSAYSVPLRAVKNPNKRIPIAHNDTDLPALISLDLLTAMIW